MTALRKNISKRIAVFCCVVVCGISLVPLLAKAYRNPISHSNSSQEVFEVQISPNGLWATVEGLQQGLITLYNSHFNSAKKSFKKAYPNIADYPWAPDSHALILFKSGAFNLFYPQNKLLKNVPYVEKTQNIMRTTSPPFVWSLNSRYIANGENAYNFKTKIFFSNVVIWDTKGKEIKKQYYPFLNVREITWMDPNTLFVIGYKSTGTNVTEKEQMALISVQTHKLQRFTISHAIPICKVGSSEVSPYPDVTGRIVCILHKPSEDLLCYIDLKRKKIITINHLEKTGEDRDWQLLWANQKRIYFWRTTPNGKALKTFLPEKQTLSSTHTINVSGRISADLKGNIGGWKNGRLENFGIFSR